jgi:uncharacterized membrane protein YeaQ/YmgE (transglycosylase-associated protein family)
MITYLIGLVLTGLVVGALGRLAIPGPNPMSIGMTIGLGIVGSFVGGLIGYAIFRDPNAGGILLAVICTAAIIWFLQRREVRT